MLNIYLVIALWVALSVNFVGGSLIEEYRYSLPRFTYHSSSHSNTNRSVYDREIVFKSELAIVSGKVIPVYRLQMASFFLRSSKWSDIAMLLYYCENDEDAVVRCIAWMALNQTLDVKMAKIARVDSTKIQIPIHHKLKYYKHASRGHL